MLHQGKRKFNITHAHLHNSCATSLQLQQICLIKDGTSTLHLCTVHLSYSTVDSFSVSQSNKLMRASDNKVPERFLNVSAGLSTSDLPEKGSST